MSSITGVTSTNGIFTIQTSSGETQSSSFGDLIMSMGMMQLELQDAYFEAQYQKANQMAEEMREVNNFVALLTRLKGNFDSDGKATTDPKEGDSKRSVMSESDVAQWEAYYDKFIDTCKINNGASTDGTDGIRTETRNVYDTKVISKSIFSVKTERTLRETIEEVTFSLQDVTNTLTSAEAYQKNLSSMNEQEMMVTNQAASRRSNVLQQLQTLLATEKEGRSAATR